MPPKAGKPAATPTPKAAAEESTSTKTYVLLALALVLAALALRAPKEPATVVQAGSSPVAGSLHEVAEPPKGEIVAAVTGQYVNNFRTSRGAADSWI